MVERGALYWAELPGAGEPDHAPAGRRPVLLIQSDPLNRSKLPTCVVAAVTSNLAWADSPSGVLLPAGVNGLGRDSVANLTQIATVSRRELLEPAGRVPAELMVLVDQALRAALGL
ncbi:MAG: type II toxin-antitoxin system PemK/MazF family toxin [Bifidobacteriaceae bacterium]|jgi:mRNA interferase MazF|nr:type II toxin-antitoxin system PemK/MazF family toxin [Bifidobacteriaceae bacterium]